MDNGSRQILANFVGIPVFYMTYTFFSILPSIKILERTNLYKIDPDIDTSIFLTLFPIWFLVFVIIESILSLITSIICEKLKVTNILKNIKLLGNLFVKYVTFISLGALYLKITSNVDVNNVATVILGALAIYPLLFSVSLYFFLEEKGYIERVIRFTKKKFEITIFILLIMLGISILLNFDRSINFFNLNDYLGKNITKVVESNMNVFITIISTLLSGFIASALTVRMDRKIFDKNLKDSLDSKSG